LFQVLTKKRRLSQPDARSIVIEWQARFSDMPATTHAVFGTALDLAADHQLQMFDAIILAASAEAGCRMLLSEDMQDGFVWRGVTVVNPFADPLHPLLADLMRP
jgi:predicted nucleic acid-binding protein